MTAEGIGIILSEVAAGRGGPPCRMRGDNGPEFVAQVVRSWLEDSGSGTLHVAPGSPWQNGYAESFQQGPRRVPEPRGVRERTAGRGLGRTLEGGV